jgi:hypothetical protein
MVQTTEEMDGESKNDPEYALTPASPPASSEIPLPAPKRAEDASGSTAPRPAPATPSRHLRSRRLYPFESDK